MIPITVITPMGLRWLNEGPPTAMDRYRLKAKNRPPPAMAPIAVHRPVAFKSLASKRAPSHGRGSVSYSGCGTRPEGRVPSPAVPSNSGLQGSPDVVAEPVRSTVAPPPCVKFRLKKSDTSSTTE